MPEVTSLAVIVGTGACEARCAHCAGLIHRRHAPRSDGEISEQLIAGTIAACYARGARSLSLSSSGEPARSPQSVTKALATLQRLDAQGIRYKQVNLYSNGIRIGTDEEFCEAYLPCWRERGLTRVYITVHDIDELKNAAVYRVASYPPLRTVFSRIRDSGLRTRANVVLSRTGISTLEEFTASADRLRTIGANSIAAWQVRGADDNIDPASSLAERELDRIEGWIAKRHDTAYNITLHRERHHAAYDAGMKLTLFQDGSLSTRWCNPASGNHASGNPADSR